MADIGIVCKVARITQREERTLTVSCVACRWFGLSQIAAGWLLKFEYVEVVQHDLRERDPFVRVGVVCC